MNGKQELLAFLGTAIATVVGLFGVQLWYASYLDVDVLHAQKYQVGGDEKVTGKREEEARVLAGGKMSIDAAVDAFARRGHRASASLAPVQSSDLSAMSGWVNRPDFAAYVPRTPPAPPAPAGGQAIAADGSAAAGLPVEGGGQSEASAAVPRAQTPQGATAGAVEVVAPPAGH